MDAKTIRGHALMLLATLAGIIGMGLVFDAAMAGSVRELSTGVPLLFVGLWWAGRGLGLSMMASRARKEVSRSRG